MKTKFGLILLSAVALSGCASVVSGTEQTITIATTPTVANCALSREGQVFARVNPTPGSVKVDKLKHDITVVCSKDGYLDSSAINESGSEGSTLGNIILGGGIGWAVDSARGADNKYQDHMNITLTK